MLAVATSGTALALAAPANAGSVTSPAFSKTPDAITTQTGVNGQVNLLEAKGAPIQRPSEVKSDAEPAEVAKAHMSTYAKAFGVKAEDLEVTRASSLGSGDVVRFGQNIADVPVFGGELVASLDPKGNLEFVLGDVLNEAPSSFPSGDVDALADVAVDAVEQQLGDAAEDVELTAEDLGATWYRPELLGAQSWTKLQGTRAAYHFEVTGWNDAFRYDVLVNPETSEIEMLANKNPNALFRVICDGNNDPGSFECITQDGLQPVRIEGDGPSGIADADAIYDHMNDVAVRMASYLNVDVTELIGPELTGGDVDKALIGTSRACVPDDDCPMPNAFWNGAQITVGGGMATSDIVAHELAHGVTEKTAGLAYMYQSGAVNEALSDIYGKIVQLTSEDVPEADRWDIGTGSAIGVIRNMEDPTQYNQPDKMTSELWFDDGGSFQDNGGVHANSGVLNKAAYLLVDGGNFNGYDVSGIGYAKTLKITWSLQNLLTSGADYKDVFHTLPLACQKQIDTPGSYITQDDCMQVEKAVRATEMYKEPIQGSPHNVDYCDDGSEPAEVQAYEGFESKSENWNWQNGWSLSSERPFQGDINANVGEDSAYSLVEGQQEFALTSVRAEVPEGAQYIRFDHMYLTNGANGRFEYSVVDGVWLNMATLPNTHGSMQFDGSSSGWSASRYDVSTLVGQSIQVRYVLEGNNPDAVGLWWIDNAKTYNCG